MQMFCFLFFLSSFFLPGAIKVKYCAIFSGLQTEICFFKSRVWTHNSSLVTHVRKDSVNSPLNHLILASIFFLAVLFVTLSKNSWLRTLCILRYKLRVLAEPEPSFGRYFSRPFIKKKKLQGLLATAEKTFHSIFTYCRCSPSLLNDGGSDLLVTCGLILHLLYCSVSC